MLRRLAISLAATSALVLTATAPALADHGDPELFDHFDGNLRFCADLLDPDEEPEGGQGYALPDDQKTELEAMLKQHLGWNVDEDRNTADVEEGEEVDHSWWDVTLRDGESGDEDVYLDVDVDSGVQVIVIVKGGPAGSNIFLNEPGEDLAGLYAPFNPNSKKHPTISHYSICKLGKDQDGEEPDDEKTPDPDDEKTPDPDDEKTPEPKTSKSPAPVPTAVPAGASGSGDTSMAPVGIAAAAVMVMAGSAALLRRRFAQQS